MQISLNTDTLKGTILSAMVSYEKNFHTHTKNMLEVLAPKLADSIRENFDSAGKRGEGERWVTKFNPTPLIDTGALYKSFSGSVEERGSQYVVIVGTDKDYAQIHNEGGVTMTDVMPRPNPGKGPRSESMWIHSGNKREKKIPKREFMFLTIGDNWELDDAQQIEDGIEDMTDTIAALEGFEEL